MRFQLPPISSFWDLIQLLNIYFTWIYNLEKCFFWNISTEENLICSKNFFHLFYIVLWELYFELSLEVTTHKNSRQKMVTIMLSSETWDHPRLINNNKFLIPNPTLFPLILGIDHIFHFLVFSDLISRKNEKHFIV